MKLEIYIPFYFPLVVAYFLTGGWYARKYSKVPIDACTTYFLWPIPLFFRTLLWLGSRGVQIMEWFGRRILKHRKEW